MRIERKIKKIEPLAVLKRSILSGKPYEVHEIAEIRFKQKTSPRLFNSEGERVFVHSNSGIYKDTETNRDLLDIIINLEKQRNLLNRKISEYIDQLDIIDIRTLHERMIGGEDS